MQKNSTEHSRAMQRGMCHRQQHQTKLYFASSCPWIKKFKSQFKLTKRKRCERGQFSTCMQCFVRTGCPQKDMSQSACTPNVPSSCSCIDNYTQNHVKIPWRACLRKKKLLVMSWKINWICIIIFNALSLVWPCLIYYLLPVSLMSIQENKK